jgi:transcriptional regulator with XRE-family HTH domain
MKIYWNGNAKNIIGKNVKALRKKKGITQKTLAEKLQLQGFEFADLTILRIEQGARFVPDYEVVAFAEFFQVSADEFLKNYVFQWKAP